MVKPPTLTEAEIEERERAKHVERIERTEQPAQPVTERKADGKDREVRPGPTINAMGEVYAELDLLQPVNLPSGASANHIVIYRPTCGSMTQVLDTVSIVVQAERFVDACCRAVNGSGEERFSLRDMNCIDASEFGSMVNALSAEADAVTLEESGDGLTAPVIYTLKRPIKLTPQIPDSETVEQFAFEARKMGDISEYLDARGETREFHTFMRTFGKPLGIRIPIMTDILIQALDVLDYLVIRRQIVPKFTASRNRWKRASSLALSPTIGPQAHGMH